MATNDDKCGRQRQRAKPVRVPALAAGAKLIRKRRVAILDERIAGVKSQQSMAACARGGSNMYNIKREGFSTFSTFSERGCFGLSFLFEVVSFFGACRLLRGIAPQTKPNPTTNNA